MQNRSVLISIRPKWCELIANGEKAVEVRKSKPKLKTPFKCYIYCTKGETLLKSITNSLFIDRTYRNNENLYWYEVANGKVVGEFVCDTIVTDKTFGHDPLFNGAACMSEGEAAAYSCQSPMYGWHISDLVIYDKPKELNEFCKIIGSSEYEPLTRPPQSWCYVHKLDDIWRKEEKNDRTRKIT